MKSLNYYEVQAVSGGFLGEFTPFAFNLGLISGRSGFSLENAIIVSTCWGATYSFLDELNHSRNIFLGIVNAMAGAGAALIFSHIGYELGKSIANEAASA